MNDRNDREELIDRHLRGELDESEKERLAELLDADPEARQEFVDHVQWDTEFIEALRESTHSSTDEYALTSKSVFAGGQWASKPRALRLMLAAAAAVIVVLSAGLIYQTAYPKIGSPEDTIAKITGLSGSLIWTGDRGQIVRNVKVGKRLAGGTIEGTAPDSWFELQFDDGSTVMISGSSMLTFADMGQKRLRLREGTFSANVVAQPKGKPMLIHTPSTRIEVLGTRFDIEANIASTMLNVTEGKVRVRRLSDGTEVDVPEKHRVIAEGGGDLTLTRVPDSVDHWTSQIQSGPGGYGKWLPPKDKRMAAQQAIPLVPPQNPETTLYLAGIPVSRSMGSPVVVRSGSRFVVRGHIERPARIYFGIGVSDTSGEFAGKFRGDLGDRQPISVPDAEGRFEVEYRISAFTLDPCVRDRKEELPSKPDDLVLNGVWAFTHLQGPSGLKITEVELIPSEHQFHKAK